MPEKLPSLFIGSSTEDKSLAEAFGKELAKVADVTLWTEVKYKDVNKYFLDSLVEASGRFDFALLIFGLADEIDLRGSTRLTARDNVIFELGLFWSRLGRQRTFAVVPRLSRDSYRILSDLDGLELATYSPSSASGEDSPVIDEACVKIKGKILREGHHDRSDAPKAVADVTRELTELIKTAREKAEPIVVKNIALDMESTWPMVREKILSASNVKAVTWHSLMVDVESEQMNRMWSTTVSRDIAVTAENNIRKDCRILRDALGERQIDFACRTYATPPTVHGFLFNGTTAFLALCGIRNGELVGAPNPYIRLDRSSDDSASTLLIQAFESWFDHRWSTGGRTIWPE